MISRFIAYLQESRSELRRVNWPTRQETVKMTSMVIAMSLAVALFLGLLDAFFNYVLTKFL